MMLLRNRFARLAVVKYRPMCQSILIRHQTFAACVSRRQQSTATAATYSIRSLLTFARTRRVAVSTWPA
ncbi:Uncharacterised protein [Mycolicibacterium fortuitum]|uniref:Uncharacterized protein n=1 Tax=Mycolicibacterium fortuitum TaxID=1766 RepID=A0A378V107_MYCFO|nr:Uncharacterised protein [Mycolicibacterium fortuitum]